MSKVVVTLKNHQDAQSYTSWFNNVYQSTFQNTNDYMENPNGSLTILKEGSKVALIAAGEWVTVCIEEDDK